MSDSVLITMVIVGGALLGVFLFVLVRQQSSGGGEIGNLVIRGYEVRLAELKKSNDGLRAELEAVKSQFEQYRRETERLVLEMQLELNRIKNNQPPSPTGTYKNITTGAALFDLMVARMSDGEVSDLVFALDMDDGHLDRSGKNALIRTLINRIDDRRRMPDLIARLREVRPDVDWPDFVM